MRGPTPNPAFLQGKDKKFIGKDLGGGKVHQHQEVEPAASGGPKGETPKEGLSNGVQRKQKRIRRRGGRLIGESHGGLGPHELPPRRDR